MQPTWKILLVDDNEDDYFLTRIHLMEARGDQYELVWAPSYAAALDQAALQSFDVVLVDYSLGAQTGLDLASELIGRGFSIPVILLTGHGSYELDLQAMRAGVADYLTKDEVSAALLERTIRYAIERKQAADALRKANELLSSTNAALAQSKQVLEERVQERTRELQEANDRLTELNLELMAEIRERKRIQAELTEIQSRLMDNIESERLSISQELHDGPMQQLYGLLYKLSALKGSGVAGEDLDRAISTYVEELQQSIQALRVVAVELRPPSLAPFGLEQAIRSHIEFFRQSYPKLEVELDLMPDDQLLPQRVRLALYRIYQVAMTNVIRHAQASQVKVRLKLNEDAVVLDVVDNGCGFRPQLRRIELVRSGHLGLVGAMERAEAIGGRLQVISQPGKGAAVRVTVPRERLLMPAPQE